MNNHLGFKLKMDWFVSTLAIYVMSNYTSIQDPIHSCDSTSSMNWFKQLVQNSYK